MNHPWREHRNGRCPRPSSSTSRGGERTATRRDVIVGFAAAPTTIAAPPPPPPPHRRVCVRFHPKVRAIDTIGRWQFTDDERLACWHTDGDLKRIVDEAMDTIVEVRSQGRRRRGEEEEEEAPPPPPLVDGERNLRMRGLEHMAAASLFRERKSRRAEAIRAVLRRQDMVRRRAANAAPAGCNVIAEASRAATALCRRAALERAAGDASGREQAEGGTPRAANAGAGASRNEHVDYDASSAASTPSSWPLVRRGPREAPGPFLAAPAASAPCSALGGRGRAAASKEEDSSGTPARPPRSSEMLGRVRAILDRSCERQHRRAAAVTDGTRRPSSSSHRASGELLDRIRNLKLSERNNSGAQPAVQEAARKIGGSMLLRPNPGSSATDPPEATH